MTLLQKARLVAACHPLHPDVPCIIESCLSHHGLLPEAHGAGRAAEGSCAPRFRAWMPAAPG